MFRILIVLTGLLATLPFLNAQREPNPVSWTFQVESSGKDQYVLIAKASIQPHWAVYSQFLESEDGPIPTSLEINQEGLKLMGKAEESGDVQKGYDKMFEMNLIKFYRELTMRQVFEVTPGTKSITGTVRFMCCNDEMCLPPKDIPFAIQIP